MPNGRGATTQLSGLTLRGVLILGVAVTGSGSLGRVPLAVITLTALAAFEAVTALPAAADRARLLDWITSLPLGWDTPAGTHAELIRTGGAYHRLWEASS